MTGGGWRRPQRRYLGGSHQSKFGRCVVQLELLLLLLLLLSVLIVGSYEVH